MSTPDARLNAAERAALADLEAAASAADPRLAEALGGRARRRVRRARHSLAIRRVWARLVAFGWWGVPAAGLGLLMMVAGVVVSLALSAVGVVITTVALGVVAETVRRHGTGAEGGQGDP
jgi:hypothetical protein